MSLARAVFPYVVIDLDHTFAPEQVQVLTEAIYQERKRRASQAAAENLEVLEMEGLR